MQRCTLRGHHDLIIQRCVATSLHQQDSENVSTILFMKMTKSDISLHAVNVKVEHIEMERKPNEFTV